MPPISIIKILVEKKSRFMRMMDSGCATKNPKQEETSIASDIGPKTYRTTTLIDNTYIEGKQGIQNQIVNKNKEEETSTNLAGPPDKVGISTELSQIVKENIGHQKESKESIPTASTDHYPTCRIPKNYDQVTN
ncbi:hypothetical protein PPACK8108_LOCUS25895 [Phakopsora pachyrhizi]|uniref:Uncharacterized protein n=1 Tax=Phakopsora pachyrhizi TaxID=170000 RepID=A0AAV0BUJ7_PHAPC|nr:hypothetical protein PPACK8108_LOCUS25895 [Phakopsora pachyrhizi]